MEHRIKQTDLHLQMFFFILLQVYKTGQTNLWKWSYLQKLKVLKVRGGWAGMLCWFYFCDEDGHDDDLTGDVWLAD